MFQIGISIYLFLIVPFGLGILEAGIFRKSKRNVSEIVTNGYLWMMMLFCLTAIAAISMRLSLSELTKIWLVLTGVLLAISVLIGYRRIKVFLVKTIRFWKFAAEKKAECKMKYGLLVLILLSMLLSIGFTRPYAADKTVEIVSTAVATDSMYLCDPYTGHVLESAAKEHMVSPIEMLYAVSVQCTGIESGIFIYYILPIFLFLFFFLGIWRLGRRLCKDLLQTICFEALAIVVYWMTVYSKNQSVVTGIFLNNWNGMTLLSCVILPIAFSVCLEWMAYKCNKKKGSKSKTELAVMAFVLCLAGQLTYVRGGFYVFLMFLLSIAVMIIRKGYDYVIASDGFKKRV